MTSNTEQYLIDLGKHKADQLGYSSVSFIPRIINLSGNEVKSLSKYNGRIYLQEIPDHVSVTSTYGQFNKGNSLIKENSIEHFGQIVITNHRYDETSIRVIEMVINK